MTVEIYCGMLTGAVCALVYFYMELQARLDKHAIMHRDAMIILNDHLGAIRQLHQLNMDLQAIVAKYEDVK